MNVPFVNFGAQYEAHKKEYDEAINTCLTSGRLILQKELEEFEKQLAEKLGMKYAVGVANGTDAIVLALLAKGVDGKQISTSGYTFKATMEAIIHAGGILDIVDIDENRLIKPDGVGATIPVHIEGMVANVENAIVEDAAQAIGAKGVGYSGTFTLSFYPAKILGGFGDGGAVLTNSEDVYEKVKLLRHHWQTNSYERPAFNSRLDNVQAAFLSVKLKYLDEILERRAEIAHKYLALRDYVGLPYYQLGRVWQDYVITAPDAHALVDYLKEKGVQTLGYGMTPPHKAFGMEKTLPNTEKLYAEMLRLPCNETLTDEQVKHVIKSVRDFYDLQTV